MPVRRLPSSPNLGHLKHQAKDLLKEHGSHTSAVAQTIREFHPRFSRSTDADIFNVHLSLSDAQLTIAREYGFPSWARLKAHIEKPTLSHQLNLPHHERIEDATFRRAVALLDAGDATGLRAHLNQHPDLAISTSLSKAETTFGIRRCWNSSQKIRFATAPCRRTSCKWPRSFSKQAWSTPR